MEEYIFSNSTPDLTRIIKCSVSLAPLSLLLRLYSSAQTKSSLSSENLKSRKPPLPSFVISLLNVSAVRTADKREMGKYMREAKIAGDVAVMELSQTTIGVRTRARTLELQRRQSASLPPNLDSGYLQLRSRRLEKPPTLPVNTKKSPKRNQNSGSKPVSSAQDLDSHHSDADSSSRVRVNSGSVKCDSYNLSLGTTSYGIDIVDTEPRDRETTPCSFVSEEQDLNALGSVTGWANMSYLPSIGEMDEFFIHSEQKQQTLFIDKYNFDIANDMPLPGRYDWVRVSQ